MRWIKLFFPVFIFVTFFPISGKARIEPPLEVKLALQGNFQAGGENRLILRVKPLLEATHLKVFIEIPPGVKNLLEKDEWNFSLHRNQVVEVIIPLYVPPQGSYKIIAGATFKTPNGSHIAKKTSFMFNPIPETSFKEFMKSKDRENVIEIPSP